jgi:hypothetical protein
MEVPERRSMDMAKQRVPKIGTWPTPEVPVSVEIPPKVLAEFQNEVRIVVRHPWPIGIPVPDRMLGRELLGAIRGTELAAMLVPARSLPLPLIDTVPLPEKPISIEIPAKFLAEFKKDARIVMRHPWLIGVPVPGRMLDRGLFNAIRGTGLEVTVVPKGFVPTDIA